MAVTNQNALQPGNYTFTMRTTDTKGATTDVPLLVRMYSASSQPAPYAPLPVELAYFTASVQHSFVTLQWLTATETDNKEFVVERSTDGKVFRAIGTVAGSGNSSTKNRYSFVDRNPLTGTTYYRLKQVDFSGEHEYSRVIAVGTQGVAAQLRLQAYPNPFDAALNVTVTALTDSKATLQLFDLQGKAQQTQQVMLQTGVNECTMQLGTLTKGIYLLKLSGNGANGTLKVLKN
ncbi:T9SS type A sorting domain-containing protein [Pontibacter sp. E15-1]|uniref:T9SS type A sorting domain-containing protein n=1 Tax=Pontibacter sp. E15-1 TaxID=2919918 RepID=UPI001F4F4F9D|nr:T9SS type A sorting domain-containing protein [Pontibacter sp. E15-1]MCJ8164609.1 T9SS type A sorting domain-containing protein [Pontibacter sp. E15-1]